ncbi:MAG: EutP/PduV family microcompartment system protein [Clostridia bacterium]|nr:EutP/PduV family microcompartment system protein [Clostridia bacterium]
MQDHKDLMKKTLLVGRHGVGKTTLKQALRGEEIHYVKTQYMEYGDWLIDSPGEYAEVHGLNAAIAVYSYEADVVAMLIAANDDYSLFPPNCTQMINRDVIGIVTKINFENPAKAENWLRLSGCKRIFFVDSHTGEGIPELKAYLRKQS